jgi:hypothetical protein
MQLSLCASHFSRETKQGNATGRLRSWSYCTHCHKPVTELLLESTSSCQEVVKLFAVTILSLLILSKMYLLEWFTKNLFKDIAHTFPYTTVIDYVTLQTNSAVGLLTAVRNTTPNTTEIFYTGKAGFDKIDISPLGPWCAHRNLFREMVSTNYFNLIRVVSTVFEKIAILFWGTECSHSPDTEHVTFRKPLFLTTGSGSVWIRQNLGIDFFHDHSAFSCVLCM